MKLALIVGMALVASAANTVPLEETYWRLTRLDDKPVKLAENQREPNIVFRAAENRVSGFSGCNGFGGAYKVNGDEITLKGIISTKRACLKGMEIEGQFFSALNKVSKWKITGQELELYDAGDNKLARFEAGAPK
jgi:heat shock protein HslJ